MRGGCDTVVRTARVAGTRGVFRAAVAPDSTMLSLGGARAGERAGGARALRHRPAAAAGGGVAISDMLLLEQPGARPQSLDEAARWPAAARASAWASGWACTGRSTGWRGRPTASPSPSPSPAARRRHPPRARTSGWRARWPGRLRWDEEAPAWRSPSRSLGHLLPRLPAGEVCAGGRRPHPRRRVRYTQREIEVTTR